jgi:hypothetical protein
MGEVLTRAEIEAKYDGEWVLVGDPEMDEQMRVLKGTVLVHSTDWDEFSRQMLALQPRPKRTAGLWFGKMPEHILLLVVS